MGADRRWARELTLIAIVCVPLQVPLQVPAQQQASEPGLAEQGVPRGRDLRSVSHPVHKLANKEPRWHYSTHGTRQRAGTRA